MDTLPHVTAVHGQHYTTIFGNFDPAIEGNFAIGGQHVVWLSHARACRHHAPAHNECARDAKAAEDEVAALHACAPAAR